MGDQLAPEVLPRQRREAVVGQEGASEIDPPESGDLRQREGVEESRARSARGR